MAPRPPNAGEVAVLDAVDALGPGEVVSYGEVARRAGVHVRLVGQVLARFGDEVPWHRVVRADGSVARHLAHEQLARLSAEGVALRADGRRVARAALRVAPRTTDT
jgi:alkylated DNA nucleotide flippase Atl1